MTTSIESWCHMTLRGTNFLMLNQASLELRCARSPVHQGEFTNFYFLAASCSHN